MYSTRWLRVLAVLISVLVILSTIMVSLASSVSVSSSQPGYTRVVRKIRIEGGAIARPTGLAFSSRANAFLLLDAGTPSKHPTEVAMIAPVGKHGRPVGRMTLSGAGADRPINLTFSDRGNRLLLLNSGGKRLTEAKGKSDGAPDPATTANFDAQSLGLVDPRGMATDPSDGRLFVLDGEASLVSVNPNAGQSFEGTKHAARMDLSSAGLRGLRGLAFNPNNGHLYTVSPERRKLYELTDNGRLVASRDLPSIASLKDPQGMVFAPSGDQTDDPTATSLYLATSSAAGSPYIMELALDQPLAQTTAAVQASLVNTINTSGWGTPSSDPSGITYLSNGNYLVADSEIEETPLWQGKNLFEMTPSGSLVRTYTTFIAAPTSNTQPSNFSSEPTGAAYNPANGHWFVSDDDALRVFEVGLGADGQYGTADDSVTSFRTHSFASDDPEGVAFDTARGHLLIADGTNAEVYDVAPGANGAFDGVDDVVTHFDTAALGIPDPEGIEYNPESGHIFVTGQSTKTVIEVTTEGSLVGLLDISFVGAVAPAGLAYGPSSANPAVNNLYVADRGVDNDESPTENDGKVYEISIPGTFPSPTPTATPIPNSAAVEADARVEQANPDTNFGTSKTLVCKYVAGAQLETYLRFTVTGITDTITKATLRLYETNGTADGPSVYATSNTWSESGSTGITWNNRPGRTSGAVAKLGNVPYDNAWVEWDVTPIVTGNGTYSFVLATASSDGIYFTSRETAATPPQLVLSTSAPSTPTATPTLTPTPTDTPVTSTPTSTTTPTITPTPTSTTPGIVWQPYLQLPTSTSMVVLWTTNVNGVASVRYSTDESFADTLTGTTSDWSSAYPGVYRHRVALTGLSSNTEYHYRVYVDGVQYGGSYTFRTAPIAGSDTPFTFASLSDYGVNDHYQIALRDQMYRNPSWQLLLTAGDNEQNDGSYAQFHTNVFGVEGDLFSRAAVMPSPGNHDYETSSGAPYYDIFDLPSGEHHYSFDYGNVHFVMLAAPDWDASGGNLEAMAADAAWLDADLRATSQPWKVVVFHYPAYATDKVHGSQYGVAETLGPIMERDGVSLVINGDAHIVERTCPIKDGACTTTSAGGVVYQVLGTGERVSYDCDTEPRWWDAFRVCKNYSDLDPTYTDGMYGCYTVSATSLLVETVGADGLVKDSYVIAKDPTPTTTPTLTPTPTVTPIPPTPTPTDTPVPPTPTPTDTPVPPTPTPTDTPVPPTATPTDTPIPATATPTDTPVPPTPTPTDTPIPPTPTPTDTPIPATPTPTDTPNPATPTPTDTPVPPTATPTDTPVPPTATPTDTPIPATATPTGTPIPPTPTATSTSRPTRTPTATPTVSVYATAVRADGPVSYWRLGESSGSRASDSADGNRGTVNGGVTLRVAGALANDRNTAMSFNGSNGYISVANNASLNARGNFTLEAWAKPAVLNNATHAVVHKGSATGTGAQYDLGLSPSGRWQATVYIGGTGYTVTDTGTPSTSRWDHLVLTRGGNDLTLYVNGVAVASKTASGMLNTSTAMLAIGRAGSASSHYFRGSIDEVAVYNTALSPARVLAHYNAAKNTASADVLSSPSEETLDLPEQTSSVSGD